VLCVCVTGRYLTMCVCRVLNEMPACLEGNWFHGGPCTGENLFIGILRIMIEVESAIKL
jgi:hypothetical protein